jgi:hypothetical protein
MPVEGAMGTTDATYFRYGGNGYLFLNQAAGLVGDSSMRDVLGSVCGSSGGDVKNGHAILAQLRTGTPSSRLAEFDALVQRWFQAS